MKALAATFEGLSLEIEPPRLLGSPALARLAAILCGERHAGLLATMRGWRHLDQAFIRQSSSYWCRRRQERQHLLAASCTMRDHSGGERGGADHLGFGFCRRHSADLTLASPWPSCPPRSGTCRCEPYGRSLRWYSRLRNPTLFHPETVSG